MDSAKKDLKFIIGVALILVQLVSFIGMRNSHGGLYLNREDMLFGYGVSAEDSRLTAGMLGNAFRIGFGRFFSSFGDFSSEDYYDYEPLSAAQITSVMIREGLGCSQNGGIGLFVYDAVLTISYSFVGIIGIGLIVFSLLKRREDDVEYEDWEQNN